MNTCHFIGNIGQDPELRTTNSGTKVCSLNMAVRGKDKDSTIWVPLTFWGKTAELLGQYCQKGSKLAVTARFEMQDWQDKDNNKRQSPKFNVYEMEFLGSKTQDQPQQNYQQPNQRQQPRQPRTQDDFIESDIPF